MLKPTKKTGLPEFGGDIVKVCVQFWNFICRNVTKSFLLLKTFKDSFEIKWNNLINLISYRPGSKILAWRGFHWIWARLYKLEFKANLDFSAFNLRKGSKKEKEIFHGFMALISIFHCKNTLKRAAESRVFRPRVAELGSLSSEAKMAMKIFVKRVFTIFASNASFLRVTANLQN